MAEPSQGNAAQPNGGDRTSLSDGAVYGMYQQAISRLEAGNPASAAEVLELAVEHEPGKASLHEALGRAYFASSRVSQALAAFQRAVEIDPSDAYSHFGLGRCFERQQDLASAAKHFKLACAMADRSEYQQALRRVQSRQQRSA